MDEILTWDNFFRDSALMRHAKLAKEARRHGVTLPREPLVADVTIKAVVNAGRWAILCPWCHGGEFAREDRLFMCQSCWNARIERRYARVEFPSDRQAIETILVQRLNPQNRNWTTETLERLLSEKEA